MIAYVEGTIISKTGTTLVVVVQGIGYRIFATQATILTVAVNDTIALYTHQYVREDALELYGFERSEEQAMFVTLIGVTGVGPKSALGILSTTVPEQLRNAVVTGDIAVLTKVSGIGRKTAERLLLELKDTFAAEERAVPTAAGFAIGDGEVLEALERLGYRLADARAALEAVPKTLTDSVERLKAALKQLGASRS
ncbi:MAG: Holliday junction branch migration protein RuvA [Patescibacteria group bacterium]